MQRKLTTQHETVFVAKEKACWCRDGYTAQPY